jgi:glyoxylate reductase
MKVFVTRPVSEEGITLLKSKGHQVDVNPQDQVLSKDELKKAFGSYDAVVTLLTDKVDAEVVNAAGPQLKIIANYAVGVDNIDVAAAESKKIFVTNTPGVLTEAVGEHAFALLLSVAKRIVEADKFVRDGKYTQWEPLGFLGPQVSGKTLGVVGLGRIGSLVAQIAKEGFGMKVVYYDVKKNEEFEKLFSAIFLQMGDLLKTSDFVSIHVPLLDSTRHLIGKNEFEMMKRSSILVNTSRGPVIEETALVEALKNKTIAGAGLDVYENEPQLSPGLSELSNVVLTPHTASATIEARAAMSKMVAENIIAVFEGRQPPNLAK